MISRKILLVEPPFYRLHHLDASLSRIPLSLAYLAGAVCNAKIGWDVKILNADFSNRDACFGLTYLSGEGYSNYLNSLQSPDYLVWQEIKDYLKIYSPSVVGISVKSQNLNAALCVARIVKEHDSNIIVIFGGPHPTLVRADMLNSPDVDISAFGEGELTLVDILRCIDSGTSLAGVLGTIYRENDEIYVNPPRPLIDDLDQLPFPVEVAEKCLVNFNEYPSYGFRNIFAIRGCPFDCTFCGSKYIWTRKVRYRSVDNIVNEIRAILKIGVKHIHFDDDTFGVNQKFIYDLCNALQSAHLSIRWSCEIHVSLVTDNIIQVMKDSGCRMILMGVESGSNAILRAIKKGITIESAYKAAKIIRSHGIRLQLFFVVGFPQDTIETLIETKRAICSMPSNSIILSRFTPYIGTELFELCKADGSVGKCDDLFLLSHQSGKHHFCRDVDSYVFESFLEDIAKTVDRLNFWKKTALFFSLEGLRIIKEQGLRRSFAKLFSHFKNHFS